jgi:hypothetical protein
MGAAGGAGPGGVVASADVATGYDKHRGTAATATGPLYMIRTIYKRAGQRLGGRLALPVPAQLASPTAGTGT